MRRSNEGVSAMVQVSSSIHPMLNATRWIRAASARWSSGACEAVRGGTTTMPANMRGHAGRGHTRTHPHTCALARQRYDTLSR
eukprot:1048875-Pyramimonas_sp.AAC.1